jgi:glutamate-ammonia-ligase adenylyltransferase
MLLMARAAKHLESEGVSDERAEQILQKYMDLLEAISRRSSYFSLLTEYPHILSSLMALLESSRWGADYLIKHPHLLDELLTGPGQYSPEDHPQVYWTKLRAQINAQLDDALEHGEHDDVMMDILRQTHHTETFLTLLAELGIGRHEPLVIERVSDRLSALADLILDITLERVWPLVAKRYKMSDGLPPRFAIIAYGKLGGKELGYASDLDVVFLYDADELDQEAGERYSNLARKLIFWLTTATASGILFEIDTRLRPNGVAGLLVTSIQAFERYQMREGDNAAWVWEHQALTRARFCAGDRMIGDRFEKIRQQVLASDRDPQVLREEIILMRKRVADGHPNATESFDVKHDHGGMVDIEFIVQYLILQYASQHPALLGNLGNIALLHIAGQIGLVDAALAHRVASAYRLYREYQHLMRLDGAEKTRIPPEKIDESLRVARESVSELWRLVLRAE